MPLLRRPRSKTLSFLFAVVFWACAPGTAPDVGQTREALSEVTVASDAEKRAQVLGMLEAFVPHAESFYRASDLREPRTGRYLAQGDGVTQPRGAGNIAFAYVTLFAALPDRTSFGGVAREVMVDHTIQSIRHEALTSRLSGAGYNRWGQGTWQASLEMYGWAFAAHALWSELDADTQALVRRVVVGEANILVTKPLASNEEGDTGAEDNAWNAPTPALAAVMFPDDPQAEAWRTTAIRLALNASSTAADASSTRLVDGRPLGEWMASVNLHPDLTLENHGFFNPIYQQVVHVSIGDAAIFYGAAGQPLPEAFSFRAQEVWDELLGRLAMDDGDFAMPAGQDWTSKDYQHLAYLSVLATRFGRAAPSVYESRVLGLVARRQAAQGTGSLLGQSAVGYETMLLQRLAAVWWNHHLFGPSPAPSAAEFEADRAHLDGVQVYPYSDFVAARLDRAFASVSWDSGRPMALLVPRGDPYADDPVFSYYAQRNLMGAVSGAVGAHTVDHGPDAFSTAGSVGTRRFSMTAFSDGTAILLDQGVGTTFTYALESIAGMTGPRPIWSSAGAGMGALPGAWLNAADRLGMVVRGGGGLEAASSGSTLTLTGSVGTGSGDRAALLLPLSDHTETAALEPFATQWQAPPGWAAFSGRAHDGSLRLAVARWAGPGGVTLTLRDPRGAPVPVQRATLVGDAATFDVLLAASASRGQTLRYFVQADAAVTAQQDGEAAAVVRNDGEDDATLSVTYVAPDGTAQTVQRTLLSGEQTRARVVAGEATLAGPELESLLAGRAALADAQAAAAGNRRLEARIAAVLARVEQALAAARAPSVDTAEAAHLVEQAVERVADLLRSPSLPPAVRAALATALAALEQASGAYGVASHLAPEGRVQPGEQARFALTLINRGLRTARQGVVSLGMPADWGTTQTLPAFESLAPGESITLDLSVSVPATAAAGDAVTLQTDLAYFVRTRGRDAPPRSTRGHACPPDHEERASHSSLALTLDPLFTLTLLDGDLPLSPGGYNEARVALTSFRDQPLTLTLSGEPPLGARVGEPQTVSVLPGESVVGTVVVTGVLRTSGTDLLKLVATSTTGVSGRATLTLRFSDDLAKNAVAAQFPRMVGSSAQSAYPVGLANDGDASTFWVSAGTVSGQGPTPANPQWIGVDFGAPVTMGSLTLTPRIGYGPRSYDIQTSSDGTSWTVAASVSAAPNAIHTTTFAAPVTARHVRLWITGSWDWQQPPRNVQVAALEVRPPAPTDLAAIAPGAAWPQPFASSEQSGYPAALAFDGDANTFWVSSGTASGQGPSLERPEYLGIDFGAERAIGAIVLVPRVGYGPTRYSVEVSRDGSIWTEVAAQASAPNATQTLLLPAQTARLVRVRMTGSWDSIQPPRNVQVAALRVLSP